MTREAKNFSKNRNLAEIEILIKNSLNKLVDFKQGYPMGPLGHEKFGPAIFDQ